MARIKLQSKYHDRRLTLQLQDEKCQALRDSIRPIQVLNHDLFMVRKGDRPIFFSESQIRKVMKFFPEEEFNYFDKIIFT